MIRLIKRAGRPSHRWIAGVIVLNCALMSIHAAQLPRHISDYPVEIDKYPMEAENAFEKMMNDRFLQMRKVGVEPFATYWGDFLANPLGGKEQSAYWTQFLVFGAEFHLDELIGWQGASVFVSATDVAGSNPSLKIGNLFGVSQAYLMNTFALYGVYFKQRIFDDKFEFRIGRMAAAQLFATLPVMGLPVSSAANTNPFSLFTNAPLDFTAPALYARWNPTAEKYVQAGIFQASPRLSNPDYHGADFSFRPGDGTLMMIEFGWLPNADKKDDPSATDKKAAKTIIPPAKTNLPGVYTFGAYFSNYTFPRYSGGNEHNTYGFYAQAQQMIWRSLNNPDHNVTIWGGVTYSPQTEIALLPVMGYGGVVWAGPIPGRDEDSVLMNFYTGAFSYDYARQQAQAGAGWATVETVLEWSYIIQITENLQLQPDIQWIMQPSGLRSIPNALVLGCQVTLSF